MSNLIHEVNLHLRTAAGHERAANDAAAAGEEAYQMKMRSAGASAFAGFKLALSAAPEFQGRKVDDDRIAKIYASTKPRPWWDAHLSRVKTAGKAPREWAKRLIQWHLDPDAAIARRAKQGAIRAANHLKVKEKAEAQGRRSPQVQTQHGYAKHAEAVTAAAKDAVHAGRELPSLERAQPEFHATTDDCYGVVHRIKVAVGKLKAGGQLDEAYEFLNITARQIEGLSK